MSPHGGTIAARLSPPMADGVLRLDRLVEADRAELGAACAEDTAIWTIYAANFGPEGFDATFDALLANAERIGFAIRVDGVLMGITGFIAPDEAKQIVEVGLTYLRPAVRGTGLNAQVKRLMLGRAFAAGVRRVEFRVDARNTRSRAAVARIGGVEEGILRAERIIWTGHVRDTVLFSILKEEWA